MHIPRPSKSAGLGVLLGSSAVNEQLIHLPLTSVVRNEDQPRLHFDQAAITALAESINAQGVIQPIAVRPAGHERYEIIAGERRWLASQLAGRSSIPAVVHDVDDKKSLILGLAENLVREDLNPLETARAYAALIDEFDMTVTELAQAVGKSRPAVSNTLRLLELPDDIIAMIDANKLTEGHGRALLGLNDRPQQIRLAHRAHEASMSVRALEVEVRRSAELTGSRPNALRSTKAQVPAELQAAVAALNSAAGSATAFAIRAGKHGYTIEMRSPDEAQLHHLCRTLADCL